MDKTKKVFLGIGVLAAIALITFAFAIAASGSGVIDQNAEGVTVAASEVTSCINYQGRLTDSAGELLSGTYTMTFGLYDVSTGGTALATDSHDVDVTDGLFNTGIDFGTSDFDGKALWLGIKVGADSEMSPRQELRPVPYALSLRPGAVINGSVSGSPVLKVESTGDHSDGVYAETHGNFSEGVRASTSGDGSDGFRAYTFGDISAGVRAYTFGDASNGVYAYTSGDDSNGVYASTTGNDSSGVYASSAKGYGVYGKGGKSGGYFTTNQGGTLWTHNAGVTVTTAYYHSYGVHAYTHGDGSRGVSASTSGDNSDGVHAYTHGDDSDGVHAYTYGNDSHGVYAHSTKFHGVYGRTDSADSAGVYAEGKDSGADLILGGNADTTVGDDGAIYSDPRYTSSDIFLISNDGIRIDLDNDGDGEDADFAIRDKDNKIIFNVDESGDMSASGTKTAVVAAGDYGTRKMYALESTEVWFEDFGMTQLEDGVAVVEIDPVFAETVNLSVAYHVFFTPVDGWAPIYVANKTSTSFELRDANGEADITLEYRIVAKRLGYEDVWMEQVEPGNEEA